MIDAHVHVWELARRAQPWINPKTMAVLDRDYLLADLEGEMVQAKVSGAILVQVLNDPDETDEYLAIAAAEPLLGVVGWVDLLADDVPSRLDSLQSHPVRKLVGIRHQALAESDPVAWLQAAAQGVGFSALAERGLAFEFMLRPEHLRVAYAVASSNAGTTFVLDHAGKPPVGSGWRSPASVEWGRATAQLAELPHVFCKISGLTTMADQATWTTSDLRPYVDHLLSCFGSHRLLFGSDWPVSLRAGDYRRTAAAARSLVQELSTAEQTAVLEGTARHVYRLED